MNRALSLALLLLLSACGGGSESAHGPAPKAVHGGPAPIAPLDLPPAPMPAVNLWDIPPDRSPLWQYIGPAPAQ
jgi:hypothetical protein